MRDKNTGMSDKEAFFPDDTKEDFFYWVLCVRIIPNL